MKSVIYTADNLLRDQFNIPVLPSDQIEIDSKDCLRGKIYVFTDIIEGKEKYAEIEFSGISNKRVLPAFTYIKPDPKDKDPRDIKNISYIDEKTRGKIRDNYVLLGLIPFEDCCFDKAWGMRNHLHNPVTKKAPGIACGVYDEGSSTWSTRTYFEADSIEFVKGGNVLKTCYQIINKFNMKAWEFALRKLIQELRSIGIFDIQIISAGLHFVYGAEIYPYDIDIFMSRKDVEKAYSALKDVATSELHEYEDNSGSYMEFQGKINGIPFELCEWEEKPKNLVEINYKGIKLRGLSITDEIATYNGKDKDARICLLKKVMCT